MANIVLRKTDETATTITFEWDKLTGNEGFRFTREKAPKKPDGSPTYSHTWDAGKTSVKFSKDSAWYAVESLDARDQGLWPPVEPPIPPGPTPPGTKPVLTINAKGVLAWGAVTGASSYKVAQVAPGGATTYSAVGNSLTFTPPAHPGETWEYAVSPSSPDNWSDRKSFTWPGTPVPPDPDPPPSGEQIICLELAGWGGSVFSEVKQAGIGWYRTNSSGWSQIPQAKAAGLKVATTCVGEGGTIKNIDPARYASDLRALILQHGLTRVEILNEPEGSWFWSDANTVAAAQHLAKIVAACRDATKEFPAVKLLVSIEPSGGWQDKILAALDPADYDEGVVHPYGGSTKNASSAAGDRNEVIQAFQKSGKKIAITEVGWPTAIGQPPTGDSAQWTEDEQAANIVDFCKWVRANPQMISMMSLFQYRDYGSNMFYGITKAGGAHKKSWGEFAAYAND